jgi:hypothetical protein
MRIPNNLYRYFLLQKIKYDFPHIGCGLHLILLPKNRAGGVAQVVEHHQSTKEQSVGRESNPFTVRNWGRYHIVSDKSSCCYVSPDK